MQSNKNEPHWFREIPTRLDPTPPGGGELPYEVDGDARRKIRIKTLKETNLGVAQALFEP